MSNGVVALRRKRTKQFLVMAMAGTGPLLGGCSVDTARFGSASFGSGYDAGPSAIPAPSTARKDASARQTSFDGGESASRPVQLASGDPAGNGGYLQVARLDLPPVPDAGGVSRNAVPGTRSADGYGRYNQGSATDGVYAGPRVSSPYDRPRDGGGDSPRYGGQDRAPGPDAGADGDYAARTSTYGKVPAFRDRDDTPRDGPREGVYERAPDRGYDPREGSKQPSNYERGRDRDRDARDGGDAGRDYPTRIGRQGAAGGASLTQPVKCETAAQCHVIRPGETPGGLARQYGIPIKRILEANRLSSSHALIAGKTIVIPGADPRAAKSAVAAASPAVSPPDASSPARQAPKDIPGQAIAMSTPDLQPASEPKPVAAPPALEAACDAALSNPLPRSGTAFRKPVEGLIIAPFGAQRDGSVNEGVTISVPKGTPVKAAENGVVAYVGDELAGFGNLILIRHADDYVTAYAHADEILVKKCDVVKRGQVIAKAGASGGVAQPQLHFEIRKNSKPVDPGPLLAS